MGRFQLHFGKYMGTYTVLMFASFLLWQGAGDVSAGAAVFVDASSLSAAMLIASDFLIGFAAIAYPLYAIIAACIKRIARSGGLRPRLRGNAGRNDFASNRGIA